MLNKMLGLLLIAVAIPFNAWAQQPTGPPCPNGEGMNGTGFVPPNANLPTLPQPLTYNPTPLSDTTAPYPTWPTSGPNYLLNQQIVSLYGTYGNTESLGKALTHYQQGQTQAGYVTPRCTNGSASGSCATGGSPKIVALFLGYSNTDISICGGNGDIWFGQGDPNGLGMNGQYGLAGQPCATACPNLDNSVQNTPWNQAKGDTGTTQPYSTTSTAQVPRW